MAFDFTPSEKLAMDAEYFTNNKPKSHNDYYKQVTGKDYREGSLNSSYDDFKRSATSGLGSISSLASSALSGGLTNSLTSGLGSISSLASSALSGGLANTLLSTATSVVGQGIGSAVTGAVNGIVSSVFGDSSSSSSQGQRTLRSDPLSGALVKPKASGNVYLSNPIAGGISPYDWGGGSNSIVRLGRLDPTTLTATASRLGLNIPSTDGLLTGFLGQGFSMATRAANSLYHDTGLAKVVDDVKNSELVKDINNVVNEVGDAISGIPDGISSLLSSINVDLPLSSFSDGSPMDPQYGALHPNQINAMQLVGAGLGIATNLLCQPGGALDYRNRKNKFYGMMDMSLTKGLLCTVAQLASSALMDNYARRSVMGNRLNDVSRMGYPDMMYGVSDIMGPQYVYDRDRLLRNTMSGSKVGSSDVLGILDTFNLLGRQPTDTFSSGRTSDNKIIWNKDQLSQVNRPVTNDLFGQNIQWGVYSKPFSPSALPPVDLAGTLY